MQDNLKKCCVVLEPINQKDKYTENISSTSTRFQNRFCESLQKGIMETKKIVTTTLHADSDELKPLTPCYVKLESINKISSVKSVTNEEMLETPSAISKKTNSESAPSSKIDNHVYLIDSITPQANIEFSLELKKAINERNILTSKTRKRVFEALDEIKTKTEEESRNFKREKALLEIINSEIKYVHQLEMIRNFFMKPTREQKLLKPDDFDILFGHINTIYNINKELLEELDKGYDNVTNAFTKIAPFLKLYSVYAYEFKEILKILQNARILYPHFAKFLENQETRPEVQNKLSALLITPIQRVPRYKLLLTNLHQLTQPTEKDYKNLTECLQKIEEAADHINKVVEDQENMQRLLEFQRCLRSGEPNVITPFRKLLKEGILVKMSTKNSHSEKLYVVLMNDIIIFSKMKKEEPKVNSLKCLSIFPLNKCKVIEILDKGCLKIVCQEEELILYHDQLCETKKWIEKIKDAVETYVNDRKTLRKESSSRRPVKRKDVYEYHEAGLSPGRPLKKRKIEQETRQILGSTNYRISKRRPIHSTLIDDNSNQPATSSIFMPTLISQTKENGNHVVDNQENVLSKDLYVFGRPNNDTTRFKFSNLLGGVGSTIKRFLCFRN